MLFIFEFSLCFTQKSVNETQTDRHIHMIPVQSLLSMRYFLSFLFPSMSPLFFSSLSFPIQNNTDKRRMMSRVQSTHGQKAITMCLQIYFPLSLSYSLSCLPPKMNLYLIQTHSKLLLILA